MFVFSGSKSLAAFQAKGNPRKCAWTAVYRRLHHKGTANAATRKKKSRKIARSERSIAGLSLAELQKKRAEKVGVVLLIWTHCWLNDFVVVVVVVVVVEHYQRQSSKSCHCCHQEKGWQKSWKKINCTILKKKKKKNIYCQLLFLFKTCQHHSTILTTYKTIMSQVMIETSWQWGDQERNWLSMRGVCAQSVRSRGWADIWHELEPLFIAEFEQSFALVHGLASSTNISEHTIHEAMPTTLRHCK